MKYAWRVTWMPLKLTAYVDASSVSKGSHRGLYSQQEESG